MIYEIRGQKVMLDFDLARIYGYETRDFNNQVKRNIERFDDEFRFVLTAEEWSNILRWKKSTAKNLSKRRNPPFAFTEQGIYMLMTVLRGELAVKQSKCLIKTFKMMKDCIRENRRFLSVAGLIDIVHTVDEHEAAIAEIRNDLKVVMDNFIDESAYKHFIILDGEKIEADVAYSEIYARAKQSITVIDDYIDVKTLQLLRGARDGVSITVISDNRAKNGITAEYVKDSGLDIRFIYNGGRFHDRYVILDFRTESETFYHCGASSKDAGNRITAISRLGDGEGYRAAVDAALGGREYSVR